MRTAVLLSIRPKWCELIASGKKTVEVRKTAPKLPTPFKCYIYCTKENNDWNPNKNFWKMDSTGFNWLANGRIIGEFFCDEVYKFSTRVYLGGEQKISDEEIVKKSCVSRPELRSYECRRQGIFGWHISNLVIYEKPKELDEFIKPGARDIQDMDEDLCTFCMETDYGDKRNYSSPSGWYSCEGMFCERAYSRYLDDEGFRLTRPPQSWQYVEVL